MIDVAILGAGIGREHLAALRKLPDVFHVSAVVDQDVQRIESIRNRDDGDDFVALDNIAAALADPSIDVVDICLPPHLHARVTLDALQAGKHVICEKPLATSLADAAKIECAARTSGKVVFPVFQYRWGPALARLRHLMESGVTGAVQTAALETHWSRGADYYAVPWRGTWAGEQGGAVLGHAIHNHDLLTHIAGGVASVAAMTTSRVNDIETEDCAAISFAMTSGALCTSNITLGAAGDQTRLRIVFEHLTATSGNAPYAPGAGDWTFQARLPEDQRRIDQILEETPQEAIGFEGFFEQVGNALVGTPNNAVPLKDGIASIALVSAIYHSARSGMRVDLPLARDHPLFEGWQP